MAYITFAVVSVVVGAVTTAYASAGTALPVWLTAATAVTGYLGTALGLTAGANTPTEPIGGYPVDHTDYGETHRD